MASMWASGRMLRIASLALDELLHDLVVGERRKVDVVVGVVADLVAVLHSQCNLIVPNSPGPAHRPAQSNSVCGSTAKGPRARNPDARRRTVSMMPTDSSGRWPASRRVLRDANWLAELSSKVSITGFLPAGMSMLLVRKSCSATTWKLLS